MEPMLAVPSEVTHVEEAVEINTLLEQVVSSRGAQAVHAYPRLKLIVSHGSCTSRSATVGARAPTADNLRVLSWA